MSNSEIIAGLDIGTTKVGVVVAEPTEEGSFKILGVGNASSDGLKKGVVVNLEKAVDSVRRDSASCRRSSSSPTPGINCITI